jgi:hypothetical protein
MTTPDNNFAQSDLPSPPALNNLDDTLSYIEHATGFSITRREFGTDSDLPGSNGTVYFDVQTSFMPELTEDEETESDG